MTEPDRAVVAVCQIDGVAARRDRAVLREAVARAAALGARLVVLPELTACGGVLTSAEQARAVAEPSAPPSTLV
jgi:predicted amidohydrolase